MRAISVVAVVLYHARAPGFSGGFVGVDVFFVISGFLITSLLLREIDQTHTLELRTFWARRARRLLPNAAVTLLATLGLAALVMPPYRQSTLALDVATAAANVANFRFARGAVDYFQSSEPPSAVLHFWSLSIEEQFYLVFPVLLLALTRLGISKRRLALMLVGVGLASFGYGMHTLGHSQPQAFFHSGARVWELALGALLATLPVRVDPAHRWPSAIAWLALAVIAATITAYSDALIYPGWYALAPALGTAALLFGTANGASASPARVLSLAPLQWIGARSYSLYLWHWPLLVVVPAAFPNLPHAELLALALLVPISALTYALIEDPVRRGAALKARPLSTLAIAALTCGVVIASAIGMFFMRRDIRIAEPRVYTDGCHLQHGVTAQPSCSYGAADGAKRVVLLGDSHAAQWFPAVEKAALEQRWRLQSWTKSMCPAALVTTQNEQLRALDTSCSAWREQRMTELLRSPPDLVLISNLAAYGKLLRDPKTFAPVPEREQVAMWTEGLRSTIARLRAAGIPVVVIRDTPMPRLDVMSCLYRSAPSSCGNSRDRALALGAPELGLRAVASEVLDLTDRFCNARECQASRDGIPVYRDITHISVDYSKHLSPIFVSLLAKL